MSSCATNVPMATRVQATPGAIVLVVSWVAAPSTAVGLLGVTPWLTGPMYLAVLEIAKRNVFMVSAACHISMSGAGTTISFLLTAYWNTCKSWV